MTDKIAPDMALVEFERFIDAMDIDDDESHMDEAASASFSKIKRRMLAAIQNGSLLINDNGEAVYTPQKAASKHKEAITFHERTGASLMAMDGTKKNDSVKSTYRIMGDMCRLHPNVFSGLVGIDIKICEGIFALLMD